MTNSDLKARFGNLMNAIIYDYTILSSNAHGNYTLVKSRGVFMFWVFTE